jgi:hypothetical protein
MQHPATILNSPLNGAGFCPLLAVMRRDACLRVIGVFMSTTVVALTPFFAAIIRND